MVRLREVPAGSSKTPEPKRTSAGGGRRHKSRLPALPGASSADPHLNTTDMPHRSAYSPSQLRLISPHLKDYDQISPPTSPSSRSPAGSPPSSPKSPTRKSTGQNHATPQQQAQHRAVQQPATLQWDFLPKISDSRYQPVALLVRESIKQKLEIARRSEAEQDALQSHVDTIIQEKKAARKAKSKLTIAESAMADVKKWHRQTRLENVKEQWKTHEKKVDEVRARKWEADTNFLAETEIAVEEKEQRHADALSCSRAKQWLTACAMVRLPLILGKVVDRAREQLQADEDRFQQRNRRKIPKPQCLAYYLTKQREEHAQQRSRKPMPTGLLLNIAQSIAVFYIIRRRQAKRRSATLIATALRNRNQVDAFPRAVRLFISRVTVAQKLARRYAVVALHRRALLENQMLHLWNQVKQDLVAKVVNVVKDNTIGLSSSSVGSPTGSPKLKKTTAPNTTNNKGISSGRTKTTSPQPGQEQDTTTSNQVKSNNNPPPTGTTGLTPQQRWAQMGALRQHHITHITELLPPPEEMASLIAGHFFVIRNHRFEMGRQFREEIERYKHMKKVLTEAVLLSSNSSDGGRENPSYKLRNLKPPQFYYRQSLCSQEVLQAQVEDLMRETLRRAKLPAVLGELVETSQTSKAAIIQHANQMEELRVATSTRIQKARVRAEWLKAGAEGEDPSLSPLPSRASSPAASPTLSSLAGGSVRGRRGLPSKPTFETANGTTTDNRVSPRSRSPSTTSQGKLVKSSGLPPSSRRVSKANSVSPSSGGEKRRSVAFIQQYPTDPSKSPPPRRKSQATK